MANKFAQSVQSNFVGGLKTEFSALNFPENACIDADNVIFSITGETNRRAGFDFEANFQLNSISTVGVAINTYKWNNVAGDGQTQIIVQQDGGTIRFYLSSAATIASPLSTKLLASTVIMSTFVASGGVFDPTIECTFTDGNGYLFIFHPTCDPVYCTYNTLTQVITPTLIDVQIRDFVGFPETQPYNFRPSTLSIEHNYNLVNQGWSNGWQATSHTTNTFGAGAHTFTVETNLPIVATQIIVANGYGHGGGTAILGTITGTVTSYDPITGILIMNETAFTGAGTSSDWTITPSPNYTAEFFAALKVYPSNADVWWSFRNTNVQQATPSGAFDPAVINAYVVLSNVQAAQGGVILDAFNQKKNMYSIGVTNTTTTSRPSNGCWFAGRVFYTGVNASFQPTGDAPYYTWTENIYFSQIITKPNQFGYCYQQDDPTDPDNFDLLPDDGGVIVIQGSGVIYKLIPVQNGLIVFAANGIWFITGSQGIGFAATDYTVTKISGIQSISSTSYINVLGWPIFWNEEGIYHVKPSEQGGGLQVENMALGTILTFFNEIPLQSKKYARGDYNPITFVVQWLYRDTNETDITSRYHFNRMLNINTYKGPFYPYSVQSTNPYVCGINYVAGPGGSTSPDPTFKYLTSFGGDTTFSEERDFINWVDFNSASAVDYISTFTTGYLIHGSAQRQFGIEYIYIYTDNFENTAYSLQALWNFSTSGNSGKWSAPQVVNNNLPNFGNLFRRLRLRGHGLAVQLKFTSISGQPFNFVGWSIMENQSGNV